MPSEPTTRRGSDWWRSVTRRRGSTCARRPGRYWRWPPPGGAPRSRRWRPSSTRSETTCRPSCRTRVRWLGGRSVDLPGELRRLNEAETRLRARVVRTAETDDGARSIDLWTHLEGVDLARHASEISVGFDGAALPVRPTPDHAADRWAGARFQSAAPGAVRVLAPARAGRLELALRVGATRRVLDVDLPRAGRPRRSGTGGPGRRPRR